MYKEHRNKTRFARFCYRQPKLWSNFLTFKRILAISVAAIFFGAFLIFLQRGNAPADTIHRNVYIHGVAVGGMTAEEAEAALVQRFQPGLNERIVKYLSDGAEVTTFTFEDFGAAFDFAPVVQYALEHSGSSGFRRRFARAAGRKKEISTAPIFVFNTTLMEEKIAKLAEKVNVPMTNATFFEENGQVQTLAEKPGRALDVNTATTETVAVLRSLADGAVHLQTSTVAPQFTTEDFNFTPTVLGVYATRCYSGGDEPRRRNVIRAAERINNFTLFPGDVFSAGQIIAANVPNSGYEPSIVLVDGEPVEGIGGGVCQVVTTLYNAVLLAELEVIQRHNHSAMVSYVDAGFDATVAGNYYDLKFKNNTDRPLLITSYVRNNRLYARIHGYEARDPARTVRFEVRQIELLQPGPYREVVDPDVPRGERLVMLESQLGYHVELFKLIYMNNQQVDSVKINSSVYKPLQGVIAIGAG